MKSGWSSIVVAILIAIQGSSVAFADPLDAQDFTRILQQSHEPPDAPQAVIRSQDELDAYLGQHPDNPLKAFSARAYQRFLEGLEFNEVGLATYRYSELVAELTPNQALAVLKLFGVEGTMASLQFEHAETEAAVHSASTGITTAPQSPDRLHDLARNAQRLDRDFAEVDQKVPRLRETFERALAVVDGVGPAALSDEDARDFHEMAQSLAFYSNAPAETRQLRRAYDELRRRELALKSQGRNMRDQYVASRMFEDAIEFARNNPDLALVAIPRFIDSPHDGTARSLWRLSKDGRELRREAFDPGRMGRLIVVGSPGCSFSRKAQAAIAADDQLAMVMRKYATWLLPQSRIPDFESLKQWNSLDPEQPLLVVDRNSQWPGISMAETPDFYFMKNGQVVSRVIGWPGPEQLAKLRAGFEQVGITVP